jgi:excisionase family DNA binding protein
MELNLLPPAYVASLLHVDVETLRKWRRSKSHELPFTRIGKLIRYRMDDVMAFVEAGMVQ